MPTSPATEKSKHRKTHLVRRWLWWGGGTVALAVWLFIGLVVVAYAGVGTKIVRGVTVAGQMVGGLDSLTAIHQLEQRWATFQQQAWQFQAPGRTMTVLVTADTVSEEEVLLRAVDFDPVSSVAAALSFGRRGSFWQQVRERTSGRLGRVHELGTIHVDTVSLATTLHEKFGDLEQPAANARLKFSPVGRPEVVPSTAGQTFDYAHAVQQAVIQARQFNSPTIILPATTAPPAIVTSATLTKLAVTDAPTLLKRTPLILTRAEKQWSISQEKLQSLLGFAGTTNDPRLGFDTAATSDYLATISKEVEVKAQNSKFSVVDGRVKEFQASAVGIILNIPATIEAMQHELIDSQKNTAALVVTEEKPLTDTVATNNLGITELVGQATTNFKGSPTNRRFNLSYGAKILNGLLIQPGEEFSLVKALGKIDGAHGWKPELVIKGSKITPEFGGGLCQVGTTMFRVALNAGLPIVERHNHSLRISYYEPPIGLDATIYEPKPDLRFTNDYSTPLLLQTAVDGNLLTFSFYGTKDGRTVDIPDPKVYNRVAIPATKNIEVEDLKPGEKKCQAPGHPGADATATYTVTKADGTKMVQTFQSHYRAIGIICQVGKKAAVKPKASTNTNTATNTNKATLPPTPEPLPFPPPAEG